MVVNAKNNVVERMEFYRAQKAKGLYTWQMGRGDKTISSILMAGSLVALALAAYGASDLALGKNKKEGF